MENKINELQDWLLFGVTCLLAVALAVNAVGAALGMATLAWWHYFTLVIMALLTWESLSAEQAALIASRLQCMRKKAAAVFRLVHTFSKRAVRGLSALFTLGSPEVQTQVPQ